MSRMMIDVREFRRKVVQGLAYWGWVPRDADGADFAHPADRDGLRFKIGTSHGEVTVTVWEGPRQTEVIRSTRDDQLGRTMDAIRGLIEQVQP